MKPIDATAAESMAVRVCIECCAPTLSRSWLCAGHRKERERTKRNECVKRWRSTPDGGAYSRRRSREWKARNPDKVEAARKRYRLAHPERILAAVAAWKARNPERVALYEAKRAEKRKAVKGPTRERLSYPLIATPREEHALIMSICKLVPASVPDREDVCQDMVLAVLDGSTTLAELQTSPAKVSEFRSRHRKSNYESSGYAVSLSAPRYDGRSWDDVLADTSEREWATV